MGAKFGDEENNKKIGVDSVWANVMHEMWLLIKPLPRN